MSKANITNERLIKVTDHDCDGAYQYTEVRGDISYTCCGFIDVSANTFMGDGDGDKCPKCGAEITFSRKSAQQSVQPTAAGGSDADKNSESGGG